MALESSISSPDNTMAKELAINEAVKGATTAETWLKTKILKWLAALWIVTAFSVPANAQEGWVAKNSDKFPQGVTKKYEAPVAKDTNTVGTYKIEEPIKDSVEYKKTYDKLSQQCEELQKKLADHEKFNEQMDMIAWPRKFLEKAMQQGDVFTEKHYQYAMLRKEIRARTQRLPEVQPLVDLSVKLLDYIIAKSPHPSIVKNN